MLPTLKPGDEVLTFDWFYLFSNHKVGDLVVIKTDDIEMIKRIHKTSKQMVYVLGDNKKDSTDSRSFGWLDKKMIVGKVVLY